MSVDRIALRDMREDDVGRVVAILAHWNMVPTSASAAMPRPELAAIPIDTTIVALIDDAIVGVGSYVLAGEGRGETLLLAVDPAFRQLGVGERLQRARLARMKACGVKTVVTEADRPETIEWYVRKFGYRVQGARAKRHPIGLVSVPDWTILELDLERWPG